MDLDPALVVPSDGSPLLVWDSPASVPARAIMVLAGAGVLLSDYPRMVDCGNALWLMKRAAKPDIKEGRINFGFSIRYQHHPAAMDQHQGAS